jgi:hypothetical protein
MGANAQIHRFKRQEINLVFKIKVFVVSKIWYFNKSIYFYFPKIWVVTNVLDEGLRIGGRGHQINSKVRFQTKKANIVYRE